MNAIALIAAAVVTVAAGHSPVLAQTSAPAPSANEQARFVGVKNVSVAEAEALLRKDERIVVLDVRTPEEFKAGRIRKAENVDFLADDFREKIAKLDKTKTYLVHCASGRRSAKARDAMKELGFDSIYHLEGGMQAWQKAGKPVETKPGK